MQAININGIDYVEREKASHVNSGISRMMSVYLAMAYDLTLNQSKSLKGANPDVNIIWEFDLIQQKKSDLPRSQREWVVNQFNKRFTQINKP